MGDRWEEARGQIAEQLQGLLAEADLSYAQTSPSDWAVLVPRANDDRPLQVHVHIGDYTVFFAAFLIRAPRDNVEEVYRFLLRRQSLRTCVRFCLDEDDDILLKAELPTDWLTAENLDWMIGSILEQHERVFWHILQRGFASLIQRQAGSAAP
ncbi:MAG: YbjN domain-containing protein [Chloroflexi bacterium]|nr:YbjN domain-containing protein [Chloroflexota bacterium]